MAEPATAGPFGSLGLLALPFGIVLTILAGVLVEQLVKWFSWRFGRSLVGVAMIVAPIVTSAPELAIFTVSIFRGEYGVAWGSIVAQPFMASTIVYPTIIAVAILGWALGRRPARMVVDRFVAVPFLVFTIPLIPILFLHPERYGALGRAYGLILLVAYFAYAWFMLKKRAREEKPHGLLLKHPLIQLPASILILYMGAEMMVGGIVAAGAALGFDEVALSVVLVPIATVVPESIVGLIFVFKGRDSEGVSVVVGEKALYSTFYPGLAMMLGIYTLEEASILALEIAIIISIVAVAAIWLRNFALTAPIGLVGYIWYILEYFI